MSKLLQKWICVVSSVKDKTLHCEMNDLTNKDYPIEYAEIYLDKFEEKDRSNLCEGTIFYFNIYENKYEFNIVPPKPLSKEEKDALAAKAKVLWDKLN